MSEMAILVYFNIRCRHRTCMRSICVRHSTCSRQQIQVHTWKAKRDNAGKIAQSSLPLHEPIPFSRAYREAIHEPERAQAVLESCHEARDIRAVAEKHTRRALDARSVEDAWGGAAECTNRLAPSVAVEQDLHWTAGGEERGHDGGVGVDEE